MTPSSPVPERAFGDALPLQVWTAQPDGRLDWVNRRVLEYFGRTFEEMIGAGWQDFIHPDDLPDVVERWSAALRTGEPYDVAFRLRSADGVYRMHVGQASAARDAAGRIFQWFGSNIDIDERHRAREALSEAERRASFIAEVSRRLATSLDYEQTLRNVARMAVPGFADWCAVDMQSEDGSLRRLAVEHVDPERIVFVQRLEERYPSDRDQPQGVSQVIRTGRSEYASEIPEGLIEAAAVNAEHLALLRGLALRSYVIAPIHGRDAVRGAITFVYAESGRAYEEADVAFVEELARRAGVAIENAELVRDLEQTRAQLEEQTAELEMQTEELQFQATHLEEQSSELEMSNESLLATTERLGLSETLLAEAQSSAHLGSWEWNMATGAVTWTDEMYRLYGYEPQSVDVDFGRYLAGIHVDDRDAARAAIEEALAGQGSFVFDHRTAAADGGERFLHCRGRVVTDADGAPVRMTGSAQDVTEQRQAEEAIRRAQQEFERANRAKSDFLASMSHELRTPLNAIGGHLELIAIGIHGPVTEAQATALERIRASQEHLLGLINDILQFAKVEAGRLQYRITEQPIDDVVADVMGMLEPQARSRGLACEYQPAGPDILVRADQDRTQQILINLVGNALKFTDGGGRVTLTAELAPDGIVVRVADTGRGIPADELDSIFDPFVQVRNRADTPQGVGLGLAISRDLARAMGGDLDVESELGAGSVFTLRLPGRHA